MILAALFLWMAFFLAAWSAKETALMIKSFVLAFLAFLIATSSRDRIILLIFAFCFEPLKALLAVFVTGMQLV